MRQNRLLSVAVVGIFLLALSAVAMAGDWGGGSSVSDPGESYSTMDSGSNVTAPAPESYESQGSMETGQIPSGDHSLNSGSESRTDENVPTIDAGGLKLREGIDTGP